MYNKWGLGIRMNRMEAMRGVAGAGGQWFSGYKNMTVVQVVEGGGEAAGCKIGTRLFHS